MDEVWVPGDVVCILYQDKEYIAVRSKELWNCVAYMHYLDGYLVVGDKFISSHQPIRLIEESD